MSGLDARADRLYPALTAHERVLLVMQAAHEDRKPDWQLYSTMPNSQTAEFNSGMALLRGVSQVVTPFILLLEQDVLALQLRLTLLAVLVQWGADREQFISYIRFSTPEPCGAEDFAAHLAAARADYVPVELAADDLISARGPWDEQPDEGADAALARFRPFARMAEAEVRALAKAGALPSRGRGQSLRLEAGPFYDWLGRPVPLHAEWGRGYEVVAAEELTWQREWRARIRKRAEDGPRPAYELLPAMALVEGPLLPDEQLSERDRFVRGVAARVRTDLLSLSREYGALDEVRAELQEQLGCDDVLEPELRERVERAKASLATVAEHAATLVGVLDLPAADSTTRELLWARIREAGAR